jgi:hypothetical protein
MAHSGNKHGVFVVWRHKQDKTTIYDWGVYDLRPDLPERAPTIEGGELAIAPHPMNYKAEVICEARVPILTAEEGIVLREDHDRAVEMVVADLRDQIKNKSCYAGMRQQFAEIARRGKPKPPIEVVDDHDWSELWARTGIITG